MSVPQHRSVSEVAPSVVYRQVDDGEAADEQSDCSQSIISLGDAPASRPESEFDCLNTSDLEGRPEDTATSPGKTCRFDDEEADYLSSDSDLDWDKAPFDYDVIFEATRGQVVPSEAGLPDGTPGFKAFVTRLTRQLAKAVSKQAQALHGQALDVYSGGLAGAEQAAGIAQLVAREVERNGLAAAQGALNLGDSIARMLQHRWPGVLHAMGERGWLDVVTEAVAQMSALIPPVEQQVTLTRDRHQ